MIRNVNCIQTPPEYKGQCTLSRDWLLKTSLIAVLNVYFYTTFTTRTFLFIDRGAEDMSSDFRTGQMNTDQGRDTNGVPDYVCIYSVNIKSWPVGCGGVGFGHYRGRSTVKPLLKATPKRRPLRH